MSRQLDQELKNLKELLLRMGGLCERMTGACLRALEWRDLGELASIMEEEDQVNHLHVEIDEVCTRLLASQAPLASDLRTVLAALKINNDLERIADQACNISQNALDLLKAPGKPPESLYKMGMLAAGMIRQALDSFVRKDLDLAQAVLNQEIMVDALKREIFDAELQQMCRDASRVRQGLDLILIARNFEKIGDHATNIAEDVIFMVKGKDIRHHLGERT